MMKLIPIHTEKSTREAKIGKYTFSVKSNLNKNEIRQLVERSFGVHVVNITTINYKSHTHRNMQGKTITKKAFKKAVVSIKKDEKIDIFESKENKK